MTELPKETVHEHVAWIYLPLMELENGRHAFVLMALIVHLNSLGHTPASKGKYLKDQ